MEARREPFICAAPGAGHTGVCRHRAAPHSLDNELFLFYLLLSYSSVLVQSPMTGTFIAFGVGTPFF